MKAIRVHELGGADKLTLEEIEKPVPKADEVLVKVAKELLEHLGAGRLKIQVTEFPLEQAKEAHEAIENRKTTGKVVLTVN